jgi:hypothetical protein
MALFWELQRDFPTGSAGIKAVEDHNIFDFRALYLSLLTRKLTDF